MNAERSDFQSLLSTCSEVAREFPEGVIFIGGIAVYLHAINTASAAPFAEATHDADFLISLADMADLRDVEEVTSNRRSSKHLMVKNGFEFDIYTERQSALLVPYDEASAHAQKYGEIRVGGIEHLTVLKLEAFADRQGSRKGEKDAMDLLRLAQVSGARRGGFRIDVALPFLRDAHIALLDKVTRGPFATALARGNAHQAKQIRAHFERIAIDLKTAYRKLGSRNTHPHEMQVPDEEQDDREDMGR
ncbi:MAG: hypothetical protein M0038_13495 [Pseudomonadota bacterium]|jgi:hypothetical protein|nr:hypothetical protein [Pseudomonadota bacterium]